MGPAQALVVVDLQHGFVRDAVGSCQPAMDLDRVLNGLVNVVPTAGQVSFEAAVADG